MLDLKLVHEPSILNLIPFRNQGHMLIQLLIKLLFFKAYIGPLWLRSLKEIFDQSTFVWKLKQVWVIDHMHISLVVSITASGLRSFNSCNHMYLYFFTVKVIIVLFFILNPELRKFSNVNFLIL